MRPVEAADLPALRALNDAHVPAVNAMAAPDFAALVGGALLALVVGEADAPRAFLVLLGPEGPAQGPNHAWFREHHPGAAYIDRVVVAEAARGQGLGRRLYAAAAEAALARGLDALGCEVNLDPPNPESQAFHARLGFRPVGEARDPRNGKRVSYLLAPAAHFLRNAAKRPCPAAFR